jgi:putative glutathione S-transferase
MGLLQEGKWVDRWYQTKDTGGRFVRKSASFRNWITPDGNAGPSGTGGFKAEIGRYHLYVSLACPWAHRTLILRSLKGLESSVSVSVVHWFMAGDGWTFEPGEDVIPDKINGFNFLHQVYTAAAPDYSGRVTVPVLWDKKSKTIVSNESSEIIRMLNNAFDDLGAKPGDYYPEEVRSEIDEINKRVYSSLNNGVYKCGFATSPNGL